MIESIPERAIQRREEDQLGRDGFIRRLTGALINPKSNQSTGVVIGITGPWGSGKSSILNMLAEEIQERYPNALIVRFDPWLVSGREDLIQQFFREILGTIGTQKNHSKKLKQVKKTILKYGTALAPAADALLPGAAGVIHTAKGLFSPIQSLHEQRENLFLILRKIDLPIVVMIDELDRINDEEIRTVAQLVRAVADFPNISYVLAYDDEKVAHALGNGDDGYGREYLEKIVQFPFPLPITLKIELCNLFEAELQALEQYVEFPEKWIENERYKKLRGILIPGILKTPRDIKRFSGTFHILAGMVWGEVNWIDLLGFCALQIKAPNTLYNIGENYSDVIEDRTHEHDDWSYIFDEKETIDDKLIKFVTTNERTRALEKLLALLFRYFSPDRNNFAATNDSICLRRPLLTVMRRGLLPGGLPRSYFIDFFNMSSSDMIKTLQVKFKQGEIWTFLDRMEEVYLSSDFSNEKHQALWNAIGLFTKKPDTSWINHYPNMREIIHSMANMFETKFMNREFPNQNLARLVFDDFVRNEDSHFSSKILRRHFFIYGLYKCREGDTDIAFLKKEEVEKLAEELARKYRNELLNGEWLASLYSYDSVYLIENVGLWDEGCRHWMDNAMGDPRVLDVVSMIFYGGKYGSDSSYLSNFFDLENFKARAASRLAEAEGLNLHPSVIAAYDKFNHRY